MEIDVNYYINEMYRCVGVEQHSTGHRGIEDLSDEELAALRVKVSEAHEWFAERVMLSMPVEFNHCIELGSE